MDTPWWSAWANDALTDPFRTPWALIIVIGVFRKRLEWAVLVSWLFYIALCPFTKVEESFNVQAAHDILYFGTDLDRYDHHQFPGVVPRTFAGPLVIAGVAWPFVAMAKAYGLEKMYSLVIVRIILAALVFACFRRLIASIRRSFGPKVAFWTCLLTIFQFHFNFYASRPLPNVFALALVLLTISYWMDGEYTTAIWPAVASAFVFRSELILLYAPMFLPLLITRRLSILAAIGHGLAALGLALGSTIPLDSWFWGRWLWPEGEVWYYNVVLNKSGDWGTSPPLWYLYSVLPRALLLSLPLTAIGAGLDARARAVLAPALFFIGAYSILPHKELRFIVYTFPVFNLAAAVACNRIFENRRKSWLWTVLCFGTIAHLMINGYATTIFARAAHPNYPGAMAMLDLHRLESNRGRLRIHIDVFCAQTGISRFLQENDGWEYNKTESLVEGDETMRRFDYVLIGGEDARDLARRKKIYEETHDAVADVLGFHKLDAKSWLKRGGWPGVDVMTSRRVYLLRRKQ